MSHSCSTEPWGFLRRREEGILPAEVLRELKSELLHFCERPAAECVHFPGVRLQRQETRRSRAERRSCGGRTDFCLCPQGRRVSFALLLWKLSESKIYSNLTLPPPNHHHHRHPRLKVWFRHHFVPLSKNKWLNNPAGQFHRIRLNLVPACTSAHDRLK